MSLMEIISVVFRFIGFIVVKGMVTYKPKLN